MGSHTIHKPGTVTGVGASDALTYVTIGNTAGLSAERALTGTANQVVVTDNGANNSVVLSLPQSIAAASSPTFVDLTLTGDITVGDAILSSNSVHTYIDMSNVVGLNMSSKAGCWIDLEADGGVAGTFQISSQIGVQTLFTVVSVTGETTLGLGNLNIGTAGKGLTVKEGSNARCGITGNMSAGSVHVANTSITSNTRVFYSRLDGAGTRGHVDCVKENGVGFDLNSLSGSETSTWVWFLVEAT